MLKSIPNRANLIPETANLVFKGHIYDVYQWPQKMFDDTTKIFEMLKRPDTLQIIAIKDEKLVMVEEQQPNTGVYVGPPGGRANNDDVATLAAAKREMLEETGMSFKTWRLIQVEQPMRKIEWFTYVYLATEFENQVDQKLDYGGEKVTVLLMDFEKVKEMTKEPAPFGLGYAKKLFDTVESLNDLIATSEVTSNIVDR